MACHGAITPITALPMLCPVPGIWEDVWLLRVGWAWCSR